MEVVDNGDTAQVEQVLAGAAVAGAAALPVPDVGQGVLDLDAFTQFRPAGGAMLVAAGVPQVSGAWTAAMRWLRVRWACGCGLSL